MSRKPKKAWISKRLKAQLHGTVMANRRETIYRMMEKQNEGRVPCYVCGRHVKKKNATLEHIQPVSLGGTDEIENLSISHHQCNQWRGNDQTKTRIKPEAVEISDKSD